MARNLSTGHVYDNVHLYNDATAVFGDANFVTNVFQSAESESTPASRRHAVLSALAYQDMNARRNQLETRKSQHFEWIWRKQPSRKPADLSATCYCGESSREHARRILAREWGFDIEDDTIWYGILDGCKRDTTRLYPGDLSPGFIEWLSSDDAIFWITGKPASGKSSLMKYLSNNKKCQEILEAHAGKSWQLFHFFYDFRAHQNKPNSIEGMLRVLLFQLVQKVDGAADFLANNPEMNDLLVKANEMSVETLEKAFQACIINLTCNLCIFIDGLDEFEGSCVELFDVMITFLHGSRVKICIASRPEPEIEHCLDEFRKSRAMDCVKALRMQDYNHTTIAGYTYDTFQKMRNSLFLDKDIWFLVASIVSEASGVILWAQLVCSNIATGMLARESLPELSSRLQIFPLSLDKLYARILNNLDHHTKFESILTLKLIVTYEEDFAEGSCDWWHLLTMLEICQKLGILNNFPKERIGMEVFKARVQCRIGGLVDFYYHYVQSPRGVRPNIYVRLVHKTLSTYFEESNLFRSELQDHLLGQHLWLQLYCEYIRSAPPFHSTPYPQDFDAHEAFHFNADLSSIASNQIIERVNRWQSKAEPLGVDVHGSYELKDVVHHAFLAEAMSAHILDPRLRYFYFYYGCECSWLDVEQVLCESVADRAFLICSVHFYWEQASQIIATINISRRVKEFALCRLLLSVRQSSGAPNTIKKLVDWIDLLSTECTASFFYAANFREIAYGSAISWLLLRRTQKSFANSSTSESANHDAFAPDKHWNVLPLLERGSIERQLLRKCAFGDKENPIYWITSEFFLFHFQLPIKHESDIYSMARHFVSWLKLIMFAGGGELNSFCYSNGTVLHLIAEKYSCFSIANQIAVELIGLGADVSVKGPRGTPLNIAEAMVDIEFEPERWQCATGYVHDYWRRSYRQSFIDTLNEVNGRQRTRVGIFDEEWMCPEYWLSFRPKCYDAAGIFRPRA